MSRAAALPIELRNMPFTWELAAMFGVGRSRLCASDINRVMRNLYVPVGTELSLIGVALALTSRFKNSNVHALTAANLYNLPLPAWFQLKLHSAAPPYFIEAASQFSVEALADRSFSILDDVFDLNLQSKYVKWPLTFIRQHFQKIFPQDLCYLSAVSGLKVPISSRGLTWAQCCQHLPFDISVGMADSLLRMPRRNLEGREDPYCTHSELQDLLDRYAGCKGIMAAREALHYADSRADSIPESRLRLAMLAAKLPSPILNPSLTITPRSDFSFERIPDFFLPEFKLLVEYDGSHHLRSAQAVRDRDRDAATRSAGFKVVRIFKDDLPPLNPRTRSRTEVFKSLKNSRAIELIKAEISNF